VTERERKREGERGERESARARERERESERASETERQRESEESDRETERDSGEEEASSMDIPSAAAPPALIEAGERMRETERGREGEIDRCLEEGTVQAAASMHYTLVFSSFVMLQLFNQVSSSSHDRHVSSSSYLGLQLFRDAPALQPVFFPLLKIQCHSRNSCVK
jgi:hypothetical protein